jgi:PIN domain nuclease of toxin-antitoxin system
MKALLDTHTFLWWITPSVGEAGMQRVGVRRELSRHPHAGGEA